MRRAARARDSASGDLPPRAVVGWLILIQALACGAPPDPEIAARAAAPGRVSHDRLDALLARRVRGGLVDYRALKEDPDLRAYLALLASSDPGAPAGRAERLAYWINAYNAFVLKGVADHYPVRSIRDIGVFGRLTFFRALTFRAAGRDYTLDAIEHKILRGEFREPRVHFALVCASLGCPRLRPEAFHPGRIEDELNEATRAFIADPAKVRLDRQTATLHLSPIFEWYAEDFDRTAGSALVFVREHLPAEEASYLAHTPVTIRYTDYDWTLNDQYLSLAIPPR